MKKFKLLPLFAAGLLALVGCSSEGGEEISRKQALKLYAETQVGGFNVDQETKRNSVDSYYYVDPKEEYYPVVKKKSDSTSLESVVLAVSQSTIYEDLYMFNEDGAFDNIDAFFENADEHFYKLAKAFKETPTYTADGKLVKEHFTGSAYFTIAEKDYAFAMHFEAQFDKNGFVTSAKYELVVATDKNAKNEVETLVKFKGKLSATYYVVH